MTNFIEATKIKLKKRTPEELVDKITELATDKIVKDKEIARLNNLINTIFDFNFFKEECPLNFGFSDENEEKSQNVFYEDDYCEKNCNDDFKKCWLKYFERLQELKEEGK